MCTCGALLPKLVLLPLGERRRGTALTPPLKTHAGPQRAATTTVPCVTNGQRSSFSSCCKKDAWMVGSLQKRGNGPLPRINKEKEREEPFAIVHKNCMHEYEGKTKSRTYSPKCPRRDIPVLASPSPSGQSLKGNVLAQMRGSIVKMSAIMVQNEAWLLLPLRSLPPSLRPLPFGPTRTKNVRWDKLGRYEKASGMPDDEILGKILSLRARSWQKREEKWLRDPKNFLFELTEEKGKLEMFAALDLWIKHP